MTTDIPLKSHGLFFTLQGQVFHEFLSCTVGLLSPKQIYSTDTSYSISVCAAFEEKFGSQPFMHDIGKLTEVAAALLEKRNWNGKSLDEDMLKNYVDALPHAPAVCAIIGGMLSNEIIKSIGASSEPLRNFFFYSIKDGKGMVEYFGPHSLLHNKCYT